MVEEKNFFKKITQKVQTNYARSTVPSHELNCEYNARRKKTH